MKRLLCVLHVTLLLVLILPYSGFANGKSKGVKIDGKAIDFYEFIEQQKKSTVFLGEFTKDNLPRFVASGFLCEVKDGGISVIHLVTAKHVVYDSDTKKLQDEKLYVFFNKKGGGYHSRSFKFVKQKYQVNWIFGETDDIDIAVIPFHIDEETDDVKVLRSDLFLIKDSLHQLMDVFFLSYQPGVMVQKQISPFMRRGMISRLDLDESFYIDGLAFPGNSGSPVFVKPQIPRQLTKLDGSLIEQDDVLDVMGGRLIGIIGSYLAYGEVAVSQQTKRPRIVFEEHSGLSEVWSVDCLLKIFKSQKFLDQFNKLR